MPLAHALASRRPCSRLDPTRKWRFFADFRRQRRHAAFEHLAGLRLR
jgi:hypothetical protein